jgi:hypothetical protein
VNGQLVFVRVKSFQQKGYHLSHCDPGRHKTSLVPGYKSLVVIGIRL